MAARGAGAPPGGGRWWALLVAVLLLPPALRVAHIDPLAAVDRELYDAALRHAVPPATSTGEVVVVTVDDDSLRVLDERWPLSRATWARFIRALSRYGPRAIAVDAVFDEPASRDALDLGEDVLALVEDGPLGETAAGDVLVRRVEARLEELDGDRHLVQALADSGKVILGEFYYREEDAAPAVDAPPHPQSLPVGDPATLGLRSRRVLANAATFRDAAYGTAAMNAMLDDDGVVRIYPYALAYEGTVQPSLALAAVREALGDPARADALARRALSLDRGAPLLRFIDLGQLSVRSFADVLLDNGRSAALAAALRDRIVFVGVSAAGLHDDHIIPERGARLPGVAFHAIAAENLLTGQLGRSEGAPAVAGLLLTAAVLALFAGVGVRRLQGWRLVAGAVATIGLHAAGVVGTLVAADWWLGAAGAVVGVGVLTGAGITERFVRLKAQRRRLLEEQRLAEVLIQSQRFLQQVVDHVGDGLLTVAPDGRVASVNQAAVRLSGRGERALVGRPVAELLPTWPGLPVRELLAGLDRPADAEAGPGEIAGELRVTRPDGSSFPAEISVTAMGPQPAAGRDEPTLIVVLRDITVRKNQEAMQAAFISMVSHELRTPVTSIRGALGLVAGGAVGPISDKARGLLTMSVANAERLIRLVNDILDAAKMDAHQLDLHATRLDLGACVADAVAANEGFGAEHGVQLTLRGADGPVPVSADRDRLAQVVTNLVSNAVKFSPDGASVDVSLRREGDEARVGIRDHGPGIPEDFRPRIFEKFAMAANSGQGRRKGTGLGLSIARSLVELHGGTIGFDTEEGVGTEFWFRLPVLGPEAEGASADEAPGERGADGAAA